VTMFDSKRLTAEVAARHGLLLREDDPAMALVTMSEIVLGQVLDRAEARWRDLLSEKENAQARWQSETQLLIEEEIVRAGGALRAALQRDLDLARLQGREALVQLIHAYSGSAMRRWVALGTASALALLVLGISLGVVLERLWR
jgi:hypothetical protein